MTAPTFTRCAECDRPLAVYGKQDDEPICSECAEEADRRAMERPERPYYSRDMER